MLTPEPPVDAYLQFARLALMPSFTRSPAFPRDRVASGPGIVRLLEILENEISICLSLLVVTSFAALDKSYICPARPVVSPHVRSAFPLLDLPRETY
jgi:hypothetical protein